MLRSREGLYNPHRSDRGRSIGGNTTSCGTQGISLCEHRHETWINQATSNERKSVIIFIFTIVLLVHWLYWCLLWTLKAKGCTQELALWPSNHSRSFFFFESEIWFGFMTPQNVSTCSLFVDSLDGDFLSIGLKVIH